MKLAILIIVIITTCLVTNPATGQNTSAQVSELKRILGEMKETRNMAYKYEMTAVFPNGQKDQLRGNAYMANDNRVMFNDNDAMTMIYDGVWFYKADHREKSVVIVNVQKHLIKDYREALENDMFQNNALHIYLDSVIRKYAKIKTLRKQHDTMYLELRFPDEMIIKQVDLVFDESRKTMVSYLTRTFQPWQTGELGRNKGTTKTITCTNFRKIAEGEFRKDNYYRISRNKAILKKHKKYTLELKP